MLSLALPRVSSLQLVTDNGAALALNCSSTGSPATNVIWRKDGASLPNNTIYTTTKVLTNGVTATYDNLLYISGTPSELVGLYSCIVHDSLGRNSEIATIQVNGEVSPAQEYLSTAFFLQVCKCLGTEVRSMWETQ